MKIWKILLRQSTRYWINLVVTVLIFLGILVLIDLISWRHNLVFDMSPTKMRSLSPQTKKILKSLKKEVKVTIFYEKGNRVDLAYLLDPYTYESPKFKYRLIDLDRSPVEAKKYGILSYGSGVVESGEKKKIVASFHEEQIINAILKVTRDEEKVVYFLKGHGENDFSDEGKEGYSFAKGAMEQDNYRVEELLLIREGRVPPDASLLIVSGPKKELLENEIGGISKFIDGGGKALFMIDPYTVPQMVSFLKKYSVILGDDIIVDKENRLFGREYLMPLVSFFYKEHPIARNLTVSAVFPSARSVEITEDLKKGISFQSLAKTDIGSWAETDRKSVDQKKVSFDKKWDKKGPVSVAVVASIGIKEKEGKEGRKTKEGKIVIYGDSDFANNFYLNILGNRDLFLNTVSWLAEEEDLISLRPKAKEPLLVSSLFLTATQGKIIFWSSVVVQPALVLLIGMVIYFRRRIRG